MLATDIKTVRDNPKLKLSKAVSLGWFGLLINVDNGPKANNPLGKDARVRQAFELAIDREALNQVVFNGEFVPGNQWVSPQNSVLSARPSRSQARPRQGQGAAEGGRRHRRRVAIDFMVPQRRRRRAPSPRSCSRWWPRRAST